MTIAEQTSAGVVVTPAEFERAETDMYFGVAVGQGSVGAFYHYRELMPIDNQTVIRANRDTLYSSAVFDLDAGPVTITLPETERFMSTQVFDEDHYVPAVVYAGSSFTARRKEIGTRYILVGVRTLIDPTDPADAARVRALQEAIRVEQPGGPGRFDVPAWDATSQKKVRNALIALGETVPDSKRMFGARADVDPVRHLIGTAIAWGGNPEKDATYLNVTPAQNDGATIHQLRVAAVPVDAFWSISVYNAAGYFEPNDRNAYTLNNLIAASEPDGSIVVRFGGCTHDTANCLPITPGWNYMVRLYRPRAEILDGTWKFPEAQPVASTP